MLWLLSGVMLIITGVINVVARNLRHGVVVADHDKSGVGEKYAKETGFKYWLSDNVGDDFNDYWRSVSQFKSSQEIKKLVFNMKIC
jgi:putative DNA primase/helicase